MCNCRSDSKTTMDQLRSILLSLWLSHIAFLYHHDPLVLVTDAGVDTLWMRMIGVLCRRSGAFLLGCTFCGNNLSWAVFSEYVKTKLILWNVYVSAQVFLKGKKRDFAKTLTPKFDHLRIIMETFFQREVFNTHLVPISIECDKMLKEILYATELLLGVLKPKDSTFGWLKAWGFFSESFGSIYTHFGISGSLCSMASGGDE